MWELICRVIGCPSEGLPQEVFGDSVACSWCGAIQERSEVQQ